MSPYGEVIIVDERIEIFYNPKVHIKTIKWKENKSTSRRIVLMIKINKISVLRPARIFNDVGA